MLGLAMHQRGLGGSSDYSMLKDIVAKMEIKDFEEITLPSDVKQRGLEIGLDPSRLHPSAIKRLKEFFDQVETAIEKTIQRLHNHQKNPYAPILMIVLDKYIEKNSGKSIVEQGEDYVAGLYLELCEDCHNKATKLVTVLLGQELA